MECRRLILQFFAAAYYSASLFSAQFANKAVLTLFGFNFPICLALLQMAVMCPVHYVCSRTKIKMSLLHSLLPLAAVNATNLVSGLVATGAMSIPMFIVLRQFTLLFTLVLEKLLFSKRHSKTAYATVAVMVFGAILAALTDKSFSRTGYIAVLINNCSTALYLTLVKKTKDIKELKYISISFYTSLLCIPFLLIGALLSGEILNFHLNNSWNVPIFKLVFCLSCFLGILTHHSQFLCSRLNYPVTTAISGQTKNVAATVAGAFIFEDYIFSAMNATALGISTAGGMWYAVSMALSLHSIKHEALPVKSQITNGKLKNYAHFKVDMTCKENIFLNREDSGVSAETP